MAYQNNPQLDRIELLLNNIDRRLSILEQQKGCADPQNRSTYPTGPTAPVSVPAPALAPVSPSPAGFTTGSGKPHPALPSNRNPKPDCRSCSGAGVLSCSAGCRGAGGQIRCETCNGTGRDPARKTYERCHKCNGVGANNCICVGVLEGKEMCECTMSEQEKQQALAMADKIKSMSLGGGMGGIGMGMGGMNFGNVFGSGFK